MKKTEHIRKSGKYYPDKPFDPYNRYPYESVKEVRDWYGDFVESTEGYAYFIVWINSVPSNRCKVLLFADKKEINQYKTNDHRGGEFDDWYHFGNSTKYLPINGKSAEELNNYIAKILMDFYNKRIYEYIEKNKPQSSQSSPRNYSESPEKKQTAPSSTNIPTNILNKRDTSDNVCSKSRLEMRMELIRRLRDLKEKGLLEPLDLESMDK